MEEEWRQVRWDLRYYVSNLGRVKSYARGYPRILSPINLKGYQRVKIGSQAFLVHRLVAEFFLPSPSTFSGVIEVNHINLDKTDNRVSNLEWCDRKKNMQHALAAGHLVPPDQMGEAHSQARLQEHEVRTIRELWETGLCSQKKLAKMFRVGTSNISAIITGRSWKHLLDYQD